MVTFLRGSFKSLKFPCIFIFVSLFKICKILKLLKLLRTLRINCELPKYGTILVLIIFKNVISHEEEVFGYELIYLNDSIG